MEKVNALKKRFPSFIWELQVDLNKRAILESENTKGVGFCAAE
jgi:hypothetical protein